MRDAIIIVEGAQGAGKTTVTERLKFRLPYTNLYRLCGNRDSSPAGYDKAKGMYDELLDYMKGLEGKDINMIFDRTFFTEEVYARLGYKEYSFTPAYKELVAKLNGLNFDIYYITLYLDNIDLFEKRLEREHKAVFKNAEFELKKSVEQQNMYLELSKELEDLADNIHVYRFVNDNENQAIDALEKLFEERLKKK